MALRQDILRSSRFLQNQSMRGEKGATSFIEWTDANCDAHVGG